MAMLDLTTFDQMVGAATDQTGPPVAGYIQACSTRLYAYQIERDQDAYWSKDFGANYFDSDFYVYGSFTVETAVASSIVYLWAVSTLGNDELNGVDTSSGSWLSLSLQAGAGPTFDLYLQTCRAGAKTAATKIYTIGRRERYRAIYYRIDWDADGAGGGAGRLTVAFYDDPACTLTLPMTATTHDAAGTVTGLRHFFAFSSHNSTNNGYDADVWTGNFYVNEAPPAMFTTYASSIPVSWDSDFDCTTEDDWTTVSEPAGSTFGVDDSPAVLCMTGNNATDAVWPLARATGAATRKASVAQTQWDFSSMTADYAGCKMPLFGLSHGSDPTTNWGYFAFIAESSGTHYIRLAYSKVTGASAAWSWVYSASALAATHPYSNVVTPGHTYDVCIAHENNSLNESWIFLYIRDLDGTGEATKWRCVDSMEWVLGTLPVGAAYDWKTATLDMDYAYLGNMSGLTANVGGECWCHNYFKHDGSVFFLSCARGGSGDSTLLAFYRRAECHMLDTNSVGELLLSTDDGATWTPCADVMDDDPNHDYRHGRMIWDSANTRWLIASCEVHADTVGHIYTLTADGATIADSGLAEQSFFLEGSSMVENGVWFIGGEGPDDDTSAYFCRYTIADHTLTKARVCSFYEITGLTNLRAGEPFYWRCSDDSNRLRALVRLDSTDGPIIQFKYFKCLLDKDATNEGADMQTGTADGNTLNKLVCSTGAFTTTATGRSNPVQAGYVVRNTTDESVGYVGAVDSATTLSIVDDAGDPLDLFPDGNEDFEVVCWSKPYTPAIAEEYYLHGGWLGAYVHKGHLYLQGYDRDASQLNVGAARSWVGKASEIDMSLIAERIWSPEGARLPTDGNLWDVGNGQITAAQQSGNHYLDVTTGMGAVAFFMRLDAVDQLTPVIGKINGQDVTRMKWNGQTGGKWNGFALAT